MRIAFSGTHFSGKSTLISALLNRLPGYTSIKEPYLLLEEEGYVFADPPSTEDFEAQLDCSVQCIKESKENTLIDRSPLDFLAYAEVLSDEELCFDSWIEQAKEALDRLDLIVFVPIEEKDRIRVPMSEDLRLRRRVDAKIRDLLLDDFLGILENVPVLEVAGSIEDRTRTVEDYLMEQS